MKAARLHTLALAFACSLVFWPATGEGAQGTTPLPPPRPAELRPQEAPADKPARPAPPQDSCVAELQLRYGAGITRAEPKDPAEPACQINEPVRVSALVLGSQTVKLEPPPTLGCEMAARVASWIAGSVQPLVRGSFGRELIELRVGGGHECRLRNRAATGVRSEHATGRALDIFGFVLADSPSGGVVSVAKPDGDLQRQFLDAVRQSACGAFSTSLGPGADAAHADHLHMDIQARRSPASKFCQ